MNLTTFKVVLLAPTIALMAIPGIRAQAPSSYELQALPAGQGNSRIQPPRSLGCAWVGARIQRFAAKFPTDWNREFLDAYQGKITTATGKW
jgi:hypothetical protein